MKKPAKFWEKMADDNVRCTLCPRKCTIVPGEVGYCRARKNEDGELFTLVYGETVSLTPDPIEKKPLYHFWPGTMVFSTSTAGCNFSCKHCQNWTISQTSVDEIGTEKVTPEQAIEYTHRYDCQGIAYTYAEPAIWFDYCYDTAKLAHQEGLYNVYVTNGYMELDAWEELKPYLDGMNVDVKALDDRFYREVCGVPSPDPVLETCEWAVENGIHLEVTNLIIPKENDETEQIRRLCRWMIDELKPEVPIHFSRFHPMYKMLDKPSTPVRTLERALDIAKEEGLKHVYIGNVPGHEADNTYCPECGELLIKRSGYSILNYNLENDRCPECEAKINITGKYLPGRRRWF